VDEDTIGLTFEEWDPLEDTDASQIPMKMIVNSSELCTVDFDLRDVIPLQLEAESRGDVGDYMYLDGKHSRPKCL
jgi:hypothetical protein